MHLFFIFCFLLQNVVLLVVVEFVIVKQTLKLKINKKVKQTLKLKINKKVELVHSWRRHVYNDRNLNPTAKTSLLIDSNNDENNNNKINKIFIKMPTQTLDSNFQNPSKKILHSHLNTTATKQVQQQEQDIKVRMVLLSRLFLNTLQYFTHT
jgi:hypothetical protein